MEKKTRNVPKSRSSLEYLDKFDKIDEYNNEKDLSSVLDSIDNLK